MTNHNNRHVVTLDCAQVELAAYEGVRRVIAALRRNGKETYPDFLSNQWERKIQSCGAELSVSLALNQRWTAVHVGPGGPDVGENIEVRWTEYEDSGHLIVKPNDNDAYVAVFVTGRLPSFALGGWLYAREAKRPEWKRAQGGVTKYWVPQSALRPIVELTDPVDAF